MAILANLSPMSPVCFVTHLTGLDRLAPWTDALILRLDEAARPEAWTGINSS